MSQQGGTNPHCQTVADAERLAADLQPPIRQRLYGIFYQGLDGKARWGMYRNGRKARKLAKQYEGLCLSMPLPESLSWDAPTFRVSCDRVEGDWRPKAPPEPPPPLTLEEWAKDWPYTVSAHPNGAMWTPDTTICEDHRRKAWRLADYRVSAVSGGSIWFWPR